MKSNCLLASLVVLVSFIASGCAFSVHQTPLNYSYSGPLPKDGIKTPTKSLTFGDIKDSRDVTTPKMIMNMRNANGYRTSGGWEAEKPIADIVKDALGEGIKLSGLGLTPKGDLLLTGEVMDYSGEEKHSKPFYGVFSSKLTVKLQLRDEISKKILWRDTFIGQATIDKGNYIKDGFIMALGDKIGCQVYTIDRFIGL